MSEPTVPTWPALRLADWRDTCTALHLWTQIVGKVRLAQSAWINHSWHVTLYLTARGLGTSPIPHGKRTFQIDFDFIAHCLTVQASDGRGGGFSLEAQSVASFQRRLMAVLQQLDLPVRINQQPNEIAEARRFDEDDQPRPYDADYAQRYWRALVQADRVFKLFRARFRGKCSPVHYFWGAPDLAVTRFSGRPAPRHPGGVPNLPDRVAREAYSHEVSSSGFWPGGGGVDAAFYAYAYPEPAGYAQAAVTPASAYYSSELREFILPYEAVRQADNPDQLLLDFLQSTYEAAADLAEWARSELEVPASATH